MTDRKSRAGLLKSQHTKCQGQGNPLYGRRFLLSLVGATFSRAALSSISRTPLPIFLSRDTRCGGACSQSPLDCEGHKFFPQLVARPATLLNLQVVLPRVSVFLPRAPSLAASLLGRCSTLWTSFQLPF